MKKNIHRRIQPLNCSLFAVAALTLATTSCAKEHQTEQNSVGTTKSQIATSEGDTNNKSAQQRENGNVTTKMFSDGTFLSYNKANPNDIKASFISIEPVSAQAKFKQIMSILKTCGADPTLIERAAPRIESNPTLDQENFTLPLKFQGKSYNFTYISNTEHRVYTLNYHFTKLN